MGLTLLTERHEEQIAGVLSCWDRMLVFGTLPKICYAEGMTSYLYANDVRIFDYPRFAEPFRDQLKQNATDIVFNRPADLAALYDNLVRTAIHTVKPDNIAPFLGRKLNSQYEGEMGNRFNIRIEGTRIKHTMGPVSLKLYDKFGLMLRIETTVNDLTFFKHYREVEHRDGSRETRWASMQKTIYSLPALRELLEAANRR
jgi:hypothetical protein